MKKDGRMGKLVKMRSKLTERQVKILRYAMNYGADIKTLAVMFGVKVANLYWIRRGDSWKHITI